jgi:hypothetical protein
MILLVPGLSGGEFIEVDFAVRPSAEIGGAVAAEHVVVDEKALGQPFSQLSQEDQRSVLVDLPSSAGGLYIGSSEESEPVASGLSAAIKTP